MILYEKTFFHPFTKSSFGFLHVEKNWENNGSEEYTGSQIQDINLFYQPVQDPMIGLAFFAVRTLIVFLGEYIHIKVFNLMKKENGLIKDVARLFTIMQMIYWPFWLIFSTTTDFIHPLNKVFGEWYCFMGWFIHWSCWTYISFHSFIVAIMRYIFIVHNSKVNAYGGEKAKRIFFFLSIAIPVFLIIWGIIELPDRPVDPTSFINKCYGKHHKKFLIDTSTLNTVKSGFCEFGRYDEFKGPVYSIIATIKRIFCISKAILYIVMGFNICEGFIYYRTLKHISR